MSWIFPPEGCQGTPANAAAITHLRFAEHCVGRAIPGRPAQFEFYIDFYDGEMLVVEWVFKMPEARERAIKDIKARLSGGQS